MMNDVGGGDDDVVLGVNKLCACCWLSASSWGRSSSNTTPGDACIQQVVRRSIHGQAVEEHHLTIDSTLTITRWRLYWVFWRLPNFAVVIVLIK